MMLADLMFRKEEHDAATYHFQQVRYMLNSTIHSNLR